MRRGKLHYNADRWWVYCADRMGWQVGHWIDKFTDGTPAQFGPERGTGSKHAPPLCARTAGVTPGPSTFNGNAADATQANTHPSRVCADAAAPTPQVWRTRK